MGLFKGGKAVAIDGKYGSITGEIFYKELAIQASINLIANTIARSEFLTFEKGEHVRKENYYLFNVEPNQNKSASEFWRDVVSRLIYDNKCLIIQQGGMFYAADSFEVKEFALKENIYKNIIVNGYELKNTYKESEVFHFKLHDSKIKNVIDGLYSSYSKLITVSDKSYKKRNARRGKLIIDSSYPQTEEAQNDLEDLLKNRFDKFFNAEGDAVLPFSKGLEYDELENIAGQKSNTDGREIRAFIDDVFDFIAMAFQIPPQLLKGNLSETSSAVDNFLTFCINPITEGLADEINRKLYGKKSFIERTYLKIDTTNIKVVKLKDIANALDVLTRIGAYSVDDSLRALGMEPLMTSWSKARWMTKNYAPIEQMAKGGET